MLETSLSQEILSHWTSLAHFRNHPDMAHDVPSKGDLQILLETVFLASLKQEEGEFVRTRVAFLADETPQEVAQRYHGLEVILFPEILPFTIENIRKLAPAFQQNNTALAISKIHAGYMIHGTFLYDSRSTRFDVGQGWAGMPELLMLSVQGPGKIR